MLEVWSQTHPSFKSTLFGVISQDKQVGHGLGGTMRAAFLTAVLFLSCLAPAQLGDILKKADETSESAQHGGAQ
jgi:hypothetical protein